VAEDVRIRMTSQPVGVRDGHSAEDERAVFRELMNVVADAGHEGRDWRLEFGDWSLEFGVWRWEMGDGRWEMGDGRWEVGERSWKILG